MDLRAKPPRIKLCWVLTPHAWPTCECNVQNFYCGRVSSAVAGYWPLLLPSLFIRVSFFNTNEGSAYELHAEEMEERNTGEGYSFLSLFLLSVFSFVEVICKSPMTACKRYWRDDLGWIRCWSVERQVASLIPSNGLIVRVIKLAVIRD